MCKVDENTKVTLTLGQLKRLVREEFESWGHYEDVCGIKIFQDDKEAITDAIETMFYWIEQNTNLEIRYARSSGDSLKKYQLWGKPHPFPERDKALFDQEVELIREQLRLLDLEDYFWLDSNTHLEKKTQFGDKECTCSILFPKRYAFDFNKFKSETRPKNNRNYQNRFMIQRIQHPPKQNNGTPS